MSEEEYAALMARRTALSDLAGRRSQGEKPSPPFGQGENGETGTSSGAARHLPQRGKAFGETGNGEAKRAKYGNRKVEIDGMKFDSRHEAAVWQELMLRVKAGELRCVCRQVPFDLPGGIRYIADFVAICPDMRIEGVYDAKSEITKKNRTYINKKKQMKACWGIEIREV